MFVVVNICLLAHAEMTEDISENFFRVNGTACDFCEMMKALTEVFGYEVAREILLKGIKGALDIEEGNIQGLLMTDVGDKDFIIIGGGYAVEELLL